MATRDWQSFLWHDEEILIFHPHGGVNLLPSVHQLAYHIRICKGGGISQLSDSPFSNLSQNPSHDFAAPGFRESICEVKLIRRGDRSDFFSYVVDQLFLDIIRSLEPLLQGHKGINTLALEVMGVPDDG